MADRPGGKGALTYDPGRDAATRYPDWVIRHRPLLGVPEVMCPDRRVILLERGHSAAERRCSLAHAVAHIDLGHTAAVGWWSERQEAAADRLAARRLMPIYPLTDAVVWSESREELADVLGVDLHMLEVRARSLHPAERALIARALDRKVLSA